MSPNPVVVIRYYKTGDEQICKEIIKSAAMSTVTAAFVIGLTTELHFQFMVLASAVMFIFLGVPFGVCLASVPAVILLMFVLVYLAHVFRAYQVMEQFKNIPQNYMSSYSTGFWVAEIYEPMLPHSFKKDVKFNFVRQSDVADDQITQLQPCKKTIIGTVGLIGDRSDHVSGRSAWLRYLAVLPAYRRKGVATALLNEVIAFAIARNYKFVTLATSECHHAARMFFLKRGFELKQTYHRRIIGPLIKILKYELTTFLEAVDPVSAHDTIYL